jgi:hypothetical protein
MNRHGGQEWWTAARFALRAGVSCLVELRGLELLTSCLQIGVVGLPTGAERAGSLAHA